MPESLPPAADLLHAARNYLQEALLPTLEGSQRFQTRVIINVLAMVQRELEDGPGLNEAERGRLIELLGEPQASLHDQNTELKRRIRVGDLGPDDATLVEHLRQTMIESLQINNPKWLK